LNDCVSKFCRNNTSSKRKKNNNVCETVFNSKKKQKSTFTLLEYFKWLQREQHNELILDRQLGRVFNMISASVLWQCELSTESL
jgi:hypothetical protein